MPKSYPWAQCIRDQKKRYGSEETARKVCGMIKCKYGGKSAALALPDVQGLPALLYEAELALGLGLKAVSLDEQIRRVRDAWYAQFPPVDSPEMTSVRPWIRDVFTDRVIVEQPDGLYAYPYTDDEGTIHFGGPVKVEIDYIVKALDLAAYGGALKALDDSGRVGGYGVLWGSPEQKDIQGDYFTAETGLLWEGKETRPALYHHGLDPTLGARTLGDGWALKRMDEVGAWVETQLNLRDAYEAAIFGLVKSGKLGLSSGTATHLVQRETDGRLTRWPIAEISFTPTPAEPRTAVQPLKAWGGLSFNALIGRPLRVGTQSKFSLKGVPMDKQIVLEAILKFVPTISEEDADKVADLIMLLLVGGAPEAPSSEPDLSGAPEDMLKAQIMSTLKTLGLMPPAAPTPQPAPAPTAPARPPYDFRPATEPAPQPTGKAALATLRFGETPAAIKSIVSDLYGGDYEIKRYAQHDAYGRYLRYGERALEPEHRAALKMLILTPDQIKAFVLSGGSVAALKTDMSEAVDTLGGFLVPEDIRLDLLERLPGLTAVRPRADVTQTSSDVMSRVVVTGGDKRHVGAVRVTWVGDTPSTGDAATNPTFGVEKTPIHITLATIRVPRALLEDSAYPLSQKLSEWASQEFALDEDEQFLVGSGIAKPQGILPNSANALSLTEVITGHATELQVEGLIGLRYGVARQYRQGAVYLMNDTTASVVAKMLDGTGRPIWQPAFTEGEPDRLLGYPVLTSEALPDIAASAYPIIFGNLMGYQIADRVGMSVLRDETTHSEEDIVKFVFRRRLGGQVNRTWMFAVQKVSAA